MVRTVSVLEVAHPALVLGSTQSEDDVDTAVLERAGVALVRRRSGGGAVLLTPEASLWVDVVIPRHDELWDDDVGRAVHWLGHVWRDALDDVGLAGVTVHISAMVRSRWSSLVCFAGLGPGEVLANGRKVVGISQRRSRAGARFQCTLSRHWEPAALLGLLALDERDRARAGHDLAHVAAGADRDFRLVTEALLRRLPGG